MAGRAPGKEQLNDIAQQAEREMNTYQSKTGAGKGRTTGLDDYGVNDTVENKFPGSDVKVGDDLVTNQGYNRRIPPYEGGDDKTAHVYQHNPGAIDEATVHGWGKDPRDLERAARRPDDDDSNLLPADQALGGRGREPAPRGDISEQGRLAAKTNVGLSADSRAEVPAQGSRGSQFKGAYYETPESVPDQRADQGAVPPRSVT
ncbi:hypothetical protein P885DRAFT_47325 [Corynascus similis CBS 632.67]